MLITRGLVSKLVISRGYGKKLLIDVAKLIVRGFTSKLVITKGYLNKQKSTDVLITGVSCSISLSEVKVYAGKNPTYGFSGGSSSSVSQAVLNRKVRISGLHLIVKLSSSVKIKIDNECEEKIVNDLNTILNILGVNEKEIRDKFNDETDIQEIDILLKNFDDSSTIKELLSIEDISKINEFIEFDDEKEITDIIDLINSLIL